MRPVPGDLAVRLLSGVLLVLAGCSGLGQAVKVQRAAGAPAAEPRPKGCAVELLYDPPKRPYRALAELTSTVAAARKGGALDILKAPACELGADAVIVTRRYPSNHFDQVLVAGTAIKYVDEAEPGAEAPAEAPAREELPPGVDL